MPIDCSPEERIRVILSDSKAGLLVTEADITGAGCPVIAPSLLFDPPQQPDAPLPRGRPRLAVLYHLYFGYDRRVQGRYDRAPRHRQLHAAGQQ